MPRSRGFLAGPDEGMLYNNILPSIQDAWKAIGLRKHRPERPGHYVVRKKPPGSWPTSFSEIEDYKNAITFCNGTVIELLSFYKKDPGRGGNYQWGMVDEAALIDEQELLKSTKAGMRGQRHRLTRLPIPNKMPVPYGKVIQWQGRWYWEIVWDKNPLYRGLFCTTTQPWLKSGQWVTQVSEKEEWEYVESTAYDNIDVLGLDYIEDLRMDLPDIIFRVEVMNETINTLSESYYPYFDEHKHIYVGSMYDPERELDISLDFNAGFNSMIVGQYIGDVFYIFDCLWGKGNLIVEDLINKFCGQYDSHQKKQVNIYGDQTGNNRQANNRETAFQSVEKTLRQNGWQYYRPHTGKNPPHKRRHELINSGLREKDTSPLPPVRIHRDHCKALIVSINLAPIGPNFSKDKSSETRKSVRAEDATHLSDAFDYLYYGKFSHKAPGLGSSGIDLFIS